MSESPYDLAEQAAARLAELTGVQLHDVAMVLGSGWLPAVDALGPATAEIDATDLPGFGEAAVAGHSGKIRSIDVGGVKTLVFLSRTHYYEGKGVEAVVHGVRTAGKAGCRTIVLTNGCGGLKESWTPGTPVLISDHINLTGRSPSSGRGSSTSPTSTAPGCGRSPGTSTRASTRASTSSSPGLTTRHRQRCGWPACSAAISSA